MNVEGKLFFSLISRRLEDHIIKSIQKGYGENSRILGVNLGFFNLGFFKIIKSVEVFDLGCLSRCCKCLRFHFLCP